MVETEAVVKVGERERENTDSDSVSESPSVLRSAEPAKKRGLALWESRSADDVPRVLRQS